MPAENPLRTTFGGFYLIPEGEAFSATLINLWAIEWLALLDVDRAQFEKYLENENLKLDKAQLAYKMQDKSTTTQSQSDKTQNKTEAENTDKVDDKTPQITQPAAEDIKAQSVLKLSNMYKEYADYIYDDNDRRDVAQEIEALCYIGSLSREEADTLITALKLENFR